MKEIVIDDQRVRNAIGYFKVIMDSRTKKVKEAQEVTVYEDTLRFSIQCMEQLLKVHELSSKEFLEIDECNEELLVAYQSNKNNKTPEEIQDGL